MLWLKAFHLFFVIAWFAGLFYLPRLFVYHTEARDLAERERFKVMERRLFGMMTIGAVSAIAFGLLMVVRAPGLLGLSWLQFKLVLVAALIGYHIVCYRLMLTFRREENRRSQRWYRLFNEAPTVLLIAIVILAVVKPF
jgi:protoporphyrinogen IX oxidase